VLDKEAHGAQRLGQHRADSPPIRLVCVDVTATRTRFAATRSDRRSTTIKWSFSEGNGGEEVEFAGDARLDVLALTVMVISSGLELLLLHERLLEKTGSGGFGDLMRAPTSGAVPSRAKLMRTALPWPGMSAGELPSGGCSGAVIHS
jgi:hypothetical protein